MQNETVKAFLQYNDKIKGTMTIQFHKFNAMSCKQAFYIWVSDKQS